MFGLDGALTIRIQAQRGVVGEVALHSSRPLHGPRLLHGRDLDELMQLVPAIYSVCRTAQSVASVRACESAAKMKADAVQETARDLLVDLETARERLWRGLLTWPELLGEPSDTETVARAWDLLERCRAALYPAPGALIPGGEELAPDSSELEHIVAELETLSCERVFEMASADWHRLSTEHELIDWAEQSETKAARVVRYLSDRGWQALGRSGIRALPILDDAALSQRLSAARADAFVSEPDWEGEPRETTCYTRQRHHPLVADLEARFGNGLLTRIAATLVDLAELARGLRPKLDALRAQAAPAITSGIRVSGIGLVQVEAARGRLAHRVELTDGEVVRYQILAPTEWNFHPRGCVAEGLKSLAANDEAELRQQAELFINVVDPCVSYELEIV